MPRLAARGRDAPARRLAADRPGRPHRARRADPQRGGVRRLRLARGGLGSARACRAAGSVALVVAPALVALAVFAPWMVRDWLEFGNPLPGQALANALSVTGFDIFAWSDPPTLSRYLAVGPARLLEMRVDGLAHNLFTVLLIPGFPTSFVGLVALPWFARLRSLAPLAILSRDDVPRHEPRLPGLDDLGHVPPRRRPGPRPPDRLGAAGARRVHRLGRASGAAGPGPWPGWAPRSTVSASLLFLAAPTGMPFVGGQSQAFVTRYAAIDDRAGRDAPPDRAAGADHHELPDLAGGRDRRRGARPAERVARVRRRPRRATSAAGCSSWSATSTATGRGCSTRAARARSASTSWRFPCPPIPGRPRRSTTSVSSRWPAREWRPVYSAADGRSPVAPRRSRRARPA